MPLSVNAGAQKTAWYDVYHMAREPGDIFEEDCAGIKEAAKLGQPTKTVGYKHNC